jgi:hypothetical protein
MSSSGALTELAAKGAQDAYITLRPSMTFFKGSYKRHTNFAIAQIEQCFTCMCDYGKKVQATIQRNGDLLAEMYVVIHLDPLEAIITVNPDFLTLCDMEEVDVLDQFTAVGPVIYKNDDLDAGPIAGVHFTNCIGHAIIENVEVNIGGHRFDSWTGDFLQIWETIASQPGKELGPIIGCAKDVATLFDYAAEPNGQILYIPLMFWFNRSWQQALPLIALQYHSVRIDIRFREQDCMIQTVEPDTMDCNFDFATGDETDRPFTVNWTGGALRDCHLLANYVFLDTFERRLFAQKYHTYVFDQLQYDGNYCKPSGKNCSAIELRFNHPVQEIIWVIQTREAIDNCDWFDYGVTVSDPISPPGQNLVIKIDPLVTAELQLNGHERFSATHGRYFRWIQPLEHHSKIPERFIYLYSFAKDPENPIQPTGSINMSRIDNVVLRLVTESTMGDSEIRVYARSKNVMRVISGMAGIRYSN